MRPKSLISDYNPLLDPNLQGHFATKNKQKSLRKAGLIKRNGEIVSEREYKLRAQHKETKSHMKEILQESIVRRAIEIERQRQVAIRDEMERAAKQERVRQLRLERSRTAPHMIYPGVPPQSAPRSAASKRSNLSKQSSRSSSAVRRDAQEQSADENDPKNWTREQQVNYVAQQKMKELDRSTLKMLKREADRSKAFGPGPSPYNFDQADASAISPPPRVPRPIDEDFSVHESQEFVRMKKSSNTRLHRQQPGMIVKVRQQSMVEVTMKYIGRPFVADTAFLDLEDVVVEQQHCGGENIKVFQQNLKRGEKFKFVSRRHRGYPFSFVVYVNSIRVERISACCEYRYKKGQKLGCGTIRLISVKGAAPCYACNIRNNNPKEKPDPAPRPTSRLDTQETTVSSKKSEKQSAPKAKRKVVKDEDFNSRETPERGEESEQPEVMKVHDEAESDNQSSSASSSESESEAENSQKSDKPSSSSSETSATAVEVEKPGYLTTSQAAQDDVKSISSQSDAPSLKDETVENVDSRPSTGSSSSSSSSSSSKASTRKSSTSGESVISVETVEDTNADPPSASPTSIASQSVPTQEDIETSYQQVASEHSADRSSSQATHSSERTNGLTSPYASYLVHDVLLKVRNEDDMRSPTSPLADDLVEAALIDAKCERKLSVSASDITQVTPRESEHLSSSSSSSEDSSDSSSSESDTDSERN